ncbi:MAG: S9 family peptidase [Acidobacteriota bacterium]
MKSKIVLIVSLSLVIMLTFSLSHAEKRPFCISDFYKLKRIGDLALSHDGRKIAFTVTTYKFEDGKSHQTIWVMNADGSGLFQLTSEESNSHSPKWSPCGKSIAFISDRSGKEQLHLIPTDGGEAKQLTSISTGIKNPIWAHDGSFIIFTSNVYPECGADDRCNKDIKETWERGPLKAHVADSLLYRHWNFWKDGKVNHIFSVDMEGRVLDITPGRFDSPVFSLGGSLYDVSPDSKMVAFASKRVQHLAESTNSDIFTVRLGGEIQESSAESITSANEAADMTPCFSPDGKYLAYRTQRIPDYESDLWRLEVIELATGKHRLLTDSANFDYWVDDFEWSSDSKNIFFTAEVRGENPIYRLNLQSKKIEKVLSHATIDSFAVDAGEKFMVYIHRSVGEPWEIYRYDLKRSGPKKLTSFNQQIVDEVDIRPAERLTVPGAVGNDVEVFLVKPHNFDPGKKYPLIINVHGGPQSQWQDAFRGDWQVYPGAGYIVAFPNPHGSTGYGQTYTAAISGDWGGKVYEDIMKVVDHLAKLPYVDAERMGAMGWSYGGYMMNWILGHTDRFKCIASMMGVYDLKSKWGATEELWFPEWDLKGTPWTSKDYEKWSPSNFIPNFKTPTLIITGEKDFRVPYTQSLQLFTALQRMRIPSRLIVFPEAGHWPSWYEMAFYYLAHIDWFHKYLGGEPPPWSVEDFQRNRVFAKPKE